MKSSFVPTPPKVGSMFSPKPNMNTALAVRPANDGVIVPISTEKKRKVESTGGYFKRMGSPSFGAQIENMHPPYADKRRVSNSQIILALSYLFNFREIYFSRMLRSVHSSTISGAPVRCLPLPSLPTLECPEKIRTLLLDQDDRDRETNSIPRKQSHLPLMRICLCIISHPSAQCPTLEVQCSKGLDLKLMKLLPIVK
jgi:hypothetical protein